MRYEVIAKVRRRGSIGTFYPSPHLVEANSIEEARDQWFNYYSIEWELDHFISIKEEIHEDPYLKGIMEHE
jgi:hypothetical protein